MDMVFYLLTCPIGLQESEPVVCTQVAHQSGRWTHFYEIWIHGMFYPFELWSLAHSIRVPTMQQRLPARLAPTPSVMQAASLHVATPM